LHTSDALSKQGIRAVSLRRFSQFGTGLVSGRVQVVVVLVIGWVVFLGVVAISTVAIRAGFLVILVPFNIFNLILDGYPL
jgi:hypothetical protein